MNRREFIRRGVYLAGAFACLPSGALADESCADVIRRAGEEWSKHEYLIQMTFYQSDSGEQWEVVV